MRYLKFVRRVFLVLVVSALMGNAANADLIVTFAEHGGGVTVTGSGSIETLDGLMYQSSSDLVAADQYFAQGTSTQIRSAVGTADLYFADDPFTSFASNGVLSRAFDADPGVEFGVGSTIPNRVHLPAGFTAGSSISFSFTNAGDTLADFGFTSGDNWGATWLTGNEATPTESILFVATSVPEPSSLWLVVATIGGMAFTRRRRRVA